MRFSLIEEESFLSPISGILILPQIMDQSIVPLSADYVGYQKADNSVSVGINIDFFSWERSTESERLALLAVNIRCSLHRIKSRYLVDADREKLHQIIDTAQAQVALRLQS